MSITKTWNNLLSHILFSPTCGLALSWMAWHETSTSGSREGNWRFSPSISHQRQTLSTHSSGLMHHSPARTLYLSSFQTPWTENCSIKISLACYFFFPQKQTSGGWGRKMPSLIMDKLWQRPFYNPWVFLSTALPRSVFNRLIVHISCVCTPDCEIISDKTEPERLPTFTLSRAPTKWVAILIWSQKRIFFSPLSNISNHSIKSQLKAFIIFLHILCRFPRRLHPKYGGYSIFKCIPRGPGCISCSLNSRCRRGGNGAVLPFLYLGSKVQRIVPLPECSSARRGSNETNSCEIHTALSLSPPSLSPLSGWREWKQNNLGLKKHRVPSSKFLFPPRSKAL